MWPVLLGTIYLKEKVEDALRNKVIGRLLIQISFQRTDQFIGYISNEMANWSLYSNERECRL